MTYKAICSIIFSTLLFSSHTAQALTLCGKLAQGEILSAYAPGAIKAKLNGKEYPVTDDGKFIFAFSRDEKPQQKLTITYSDGQTKTYPLTVAATKWDIQNLKGVQPRKVTPKPEDEKAINKERTNVRKALAEKTDNLFWQKKFIRPLNGRTSGHFGGQRIMNGKKMNPHQGTDIACPIGTPVKAAADGIVTLSGGPYFYSGNMVVLEHGHNLTTLYAHLNKVNVKLGEKVKQGQVIAYSGKTGRVTGPHLHWGASLNGVRFRPDSLLTLHDNKFCKDL